jgi:hypothetical protein
MKKKAMGGMMDKEGRALKRKTADAKGRAMKAMKAPAMPMGMKKGGYAKKMKKGK